MRADDARRRRRRSAPRTARAYTLIEVLLSVGIMAVLMGAMVLSLAVASRALDDGAGPAGQTRRAAEIIEEIDADLALALSFSERTPAAVTFTVPDRDLDGSPETIRYSWTGPEDGRLLRQLNDGSAIPVAEDVRHFDLTYQLKTVAAGQAEDKDDEKDKGGKKKGHG
jgi:hypothetical protein